MNRPIRPGADRIEIAARFGAFSLSLSPCPREIMLFSCVAGLQTITRPKE